MTIAAISLRRWAEFETPRLPTVHRCDWKISTTSPIQISSPG
jgi:hypothetical protein